MIEELVWELVKKHLVTAFKTATVKSVDEEKETCEVELNDNKMMLIARLTATIANKNTKSLFVPKLESVVLLGFINDLKDQCFIASVSEVAKVVVKAQGDVLVNGSLIKLNGDGFGGLVKVPELTNQLNLIEEKLRDLVQFYNLHTHSETGTQTSPPSFVVGAFGANTARAQIENTSVKHGNS